MFTEGRYCRIASSLRDMVVPKTLANFIKRMTQLYEQGADFDELGNTSGAGGDGSINKHFTTSIS